MDEDQFPVVRVRTRKVKVNSAFNLRGASDRPSASRVGCDPEDSSPTVSWRPQRSA